MKEDNHSRFEFDAYYVYQIRFLNAFIVLAVGEGKHNYVTPIIFFYEISNLSIHIYDLNCDWW